MKLEEKQKIAEDLHERFSKSAIVVVTDYKGLDVSAMNDLRRKLREEDIEFQVVKKPVTKSDRMAQELYKLSCGLPYCLFTLWQEVWSWLRKRAPFLPGREIHFWFPPEHCIVISSIWM